MARWGLSVGDPRGVIYGFFVLLLSIMPESRSSFEPNLRNYDIVWIPGEGPGGGGGGGGNESLEMPREAEAGGRRRDNGTHRGGTGV